MIYKVWKYPIPLDDTFLLALPEGADILGVQVQRGEPQLWVLVNPEVKTVENRRLRLAGTGHEIESRDGESLTHIGTFQLRGGALVFHLFEADGERGVR